jgi:hypothetical protein
MPRAMRVEYPGAIYHPPSRGRFGATGVMDRGDRREDIFVDDVDRQDLVNETTLPIKWIAARVQIGTAKGAKSVLHHLAHRRRQGNVPTGLTPYAQLEFQSTV